MQENPTNPINKGIYKQNIWQEFINWMALPEPIRKPRKQLEFAKKFGVSPDTLSDWKKKDDFWEKVERKTKELGKEKTSNIIGKLYQKIMTNGQAADFKLWLQYILNWDEKIGDESLDERIDRIKITVVNSREELETINREEKRALLENKKEV